MSADPIKMAEAMKAVVEAHAVLDEFHKEVAAFYGVVDEQLGDRFEAIDPKNLVWVPRSGFDERNSWLPRWMGRFYYDPTETEDEDGSSEGETADSVDRLPLAFVLIVVDDTDISDLKEPEVWFGVAESGAGNRFSTYWDFGRYGLWDYLDASDVPADRWARSTFPEKYKFGKGGSYHVKRVPLSKLLHEALIRELVTHPLRAKYDEVFAPPNQ